MCPHFKLNRFNYFNILCLRKKAQFLVALSIATSGLGIPKAGLDYPIALFARQVWS